MVVADNDVVLCLSKARDQDLVVSLASRTDATSVAVHEAQRGMEEGELE